MILNETERVHWMNKTLDKQRLIKFLNEQANYFLDHHRVVVAGVFVLIRDDIESGRFDSDEVSE